jgi:hypothetical protein
MTLITPIIQRWIDEGRRDPDALWAQAAGELGWFRGWDRVLEWDPPTFRWFVGGQTNLGYNAVDRHVLDGHGGRPHLHKRARRTRGAPRRVVRPSSQRDSPVCSARAHDAACSAAFDERR